MNSITKGTPVFNAKTGIISYSWDDLMQEKPSCLRCGKTMVYWYSRKRGIIISDNKYIFMAPRFRCSCGRTLTMRPYFIAPRKQYSIFSIQDILNADISSDRTGIASYGSQEISHLRRWAVALVKKPVGKNKKMTIFEERTVIREQFNHLGSCWLSSFLQQKIGCLSFSMPP